MQTLDKIFAKEFREMMEGRRAIFNPMQLGKLYVPKLEGVMEGTPKRKLALVKGVTEPFFSRLNKTEVSLIGRASLYKRQVLSDGTFRKDKDGKYVADPVPVPRDSVAVFSTISIGLKNFVDGKPHTPSEGFKYVDYFETDGVRKYIYILPKEYVYRLNLCALIITPNRRRVHFKGCKLALQNGTYLYMYVVPYTFRDNLDQRILAVKSNPNFDKEVEKILSAWAKVGIIFNLQATALEDNIQGETNLGISHIEGTIAVDEYVSHEGSLADEKEDFLDEE